MRLETGMRAGRESLMTHGTALNTVADNLANVNTSGYKNSRLEFADIFAGGNGNIFGGPIQTGNGVMGSGVFTIHGVQGTVNPTGRELDAAIQGRGWFVVNDGVDTYYTRSGNFTTNPDGFLVTPSGKFVYGFSEENPDVAGPLQVSGVEGNPQATGNVSLGGNLNAGAAIVGAVPGAGSSFQEMNDAADFRTSVQVVDSLGALRDITLFFYKTGNQNWTVQAVTDGEEVGAEAGLPSIIGNAQIALGGDGLQAEGANAPLLINAPWAGGADPANIEFDLSAFTGFSSGSTLNQFNRDGVRGGTPTGVSIDDKGNVVASLNSGEFVVIGQIALATFTASDALERKGNNYFSASDFVGDIEIGRSGAAGFGNVVGQSLESSTVDPAKEFVNLIQFQQGYRAGSQVIQAMSELLTSTIQLA